MALSTLNNTGNLCTASKKCKWILYGHDDEVLSGCTYGNLVATCSMDGVAFVWKLGDITHEPSNVCKLSSGGPAFLDSTFFDIAQLAVTQGDASVGLWDVQKGQKMCSFSRYKKPERAAYPVINAIDKIAGPSPILLYGGDDGYLVHCDVRTTSTTSLLNLKAPVTAISSATGLVFVGDARGHVRWYDFRMYEKTLVDLKCAEQVVTSVPVNKQGDRLVAYTMDGNACLIDSKPFASTNDERLLSRISVSEPGDDYVLRKCHWSDRCDSVLFPSPNGRVECVNPNLFSNGSFRSIKANGALHFALLVQDEFVLCGGSSSLEMRQW